MFISKLFIGLTIIGLFCVPCFAENTVEPFTEEWIDKYQWYEAAFPDVDNGVYYVRDGVLFRENTLVAYPCEKTDKEYVVPDGIEMIADGAFADNQYLEKVVLPSSVISIGDFAFESCRELREINLPDRLLVIGCNAFSQCRSLENIVLPPNLYGIGCQAFCEASSLAGTFTIPASVHFIGSEALALTKISTIIFEGYICELGGGLIGEPNPSIQYEIHVPSVEYTFSEQLQSRYGDIYDNIVIVEMIPDPSLE